MRIINPPSPKMPDGRGGSPSNEQSDDLHDLEEASSVPNGPDYQFGDPNRFKLRPYRQSIVRSVSESIRTVMDRSGLIVKISFITLCASKLYLISKLLE